MTEVTLPGGYTTGAVLIGDMVHKPASPWTSTVHALLRHLQEAGFDGAPRALGFDDQGREMLTYLPGETVGNRSPWPEWVYMDSTLIQVGQWLRRVHDATLSFVPPAEERWFIGGTVQPGLIVGRSARRTRSSTRTSTTSTGPDVFISCSTPTNTTQTDRNSA
jgi:hypothetical protein